MAAAAAHSVRPQLIVDGYNVIHALPELRRIFLDDPAAARGRLMRMVCVLSDFDHLRVTVVFDGAGTGTTRESIPPGRGLVCVFAPKGLTADGVIEHMVTSSARPESITVASGDHMIGEVARASGAFVVDAGALVAWVDRSTAHLQRVIERGRDGAAARETSPFAGLDRQLGRPPEKDSSLSEAKHGRRGR